VFFRSACFPFNFISTIFILAGSIMALKYRRFRHKETGQVCYAPAGRYGNFLNSIKKLVNYVHYNIPKWYIAHLTLTVAENVSEVDFRHLHRVTQFILLRLKREGSDFKYIAVKEVQKRGAIHYHVLCVYSRRYVFPSPDEIAKSWGLGFVKITAPKIRMKLKGISNYIGKYIGKGYEYEALDTRKSFTASQIKQIYKLRGDRLERVMHEFGRGVAEKLVCSYRKVYGLIKKESCEEYNFCKKFHFRSRFSYCSCNRRKNLCKRLLIEFPPEWAYEGICDEPF
jgi:hypothetical protein